MRTLSLLCIAMLFAPAVLGQESAQPRVLLAFEQTRFKDQLIEGMRRQLEAAGCDVTVMEHSRKGLDAKAEDFDAVFITNSGAHSKVRPWITKWLEDNKASRDRILLHTTQTRSWAVQAEVDAVTSASNRSEADTLATEYVERVKKIFAEQ